MITLTTAVHNQKNELSESEQYAIARHIVRIHEEMWTGIIQVFFIDIYN